MQFTIARHDQIKNVIYNTYDRPVKTDTLHYF